MSSVRDLIEVLEAEDPALVVPDGFSGPHSYRGYYECLAVGPDRDTTVGAMLADLRGAIGNVYQGYKGGDYRMSEWTEVYLSEYGCASGETLGVKLLRYMLADAKAKSHV